MYDRTPVNEKEFMIMLQKALAYEAFFFAVKNNVIFDSGPFDMTDVMKERLTTTLCVNNHPMVFILFKKKAVEIDKSKYIEMYRVQDEVFNLLNVTFFFVYDGEIVIEDLHMIQGSDNKSLQSTQLVQNEERREEIQFVLGCFEK